MNNDSKKDPNSQQVSVSSALSSDQFQAVFSLAIEQEITEIKVSEAQDPPGEEKFK